MGRWLVQVQEPEEYGDFPIVRTVDAESWLGAVTGAMEVVPVAMSSSLPVTITAVPVR